MSRGVVVVLTVVASAALVALAVWTGLMCLSPHLGQQAYRDGEYRSAEKHYSRAMRVTPDSWEGWKSPFNLGTSRLHLGADAGGADGGGADGGGADGGGADGDPGGGKYNLIADAGAIDAGVGDLEVALDRVPEADRQDGQIVDPNEQPECQVRRNLSIGQELQGDSKVAAGDTEGAVAAYQLAQETLAPCQESQENQDQSERQEQKEQENSPNDDGSGGDGGDDDGQNPDGGEGSEDPEGGDGGQNPDGGDGGQNPDGDLDPNAQLKEDELHDRNQRGQEEYDDQQGDGPGGGGVNW